MYCNFTPSTIDISLNQQRGNSVFDTKRWWVGGCVERERGSISSARNGLLWERKEQILTFGTCMYVSLRLEQKVMAFLCDRVFEFLATYLVHLCEIEWPRLATSKLTVPACTPPSFTYPCFRGWWALDRSYPPPKKKNTHTRIHRNVKNAKVDTPKLIWAYSMCLPWLFMKLSNTSSLQKETQDQWEPWKWKFKINEKPEMEHIPGKNLEKIRYFNGQVMQGRDMVKARKSLRWRNISHPNILHAQTTTEA